MGRRTEPYRGKASAGAPRSCDQLRRQLPWHRREFVKHKLPNDSDRTHSVALGDVDGDGDLDLVFGNWGPAGGQNLLFLNDGKGSFTDATASRLPKDSDGTYAVAVGDVDGDGDLDLVFGNWGTLFLQQNRLYLNLDRHLHAPSPAILGKSYQLDFYAKPGYATSYHLVVPFVAMAEKKTKFAVFGTFGLDLAQTIVLPLMVILPLRGKTTLSLMIPDDARLLGMILSSQALIIPDLLFPPLSWRFTNVTADKIIR